MDTPEDDEENVTRNVAASGSYVGMQAGSVKDSTVITGSAVYFVAPDATPSEMYAVGVQYLAAGVPIRARELITDAIAHGHENGEVRFHWMLAMLSKRSYRDLNRNERGQLEYAAGRVERYADDKWRQALEVVCELLECARSRTEPGPALKKLVDLRTEQLEKIERHLDLVLTGTAKDSLWTDIHDRALAGRESGRRRDRMWAYFVPDPAGARVRQPPPEAVTAGDHGAAVGWTVAFTVVAGYLGWIVLSLGRVLPTLGMAAVLASGYVAAANGLEWRYRTDRLRVKDSEHLRSDAPEAADPGPEEEGGFARSVDHCFDYYFNKYLPHGFERKQWLEGTTAIRKTMRDEVVEIYRESRVSVTRIRWLIRHLVGEVRKSWEQDTMLAYREQYRTAMSTKILCCASLTVLMATALPVIDAAARVHPVTALLGVIVLAKCGRDASVRWLHIISEQRRYVEDEQEALQAEARRRAAFDRWKAKLEAARPTEKEMEQWLDCDKTAVLGQALRGAELAWREVIAHAFLIVPAKNCRRTRVKRGPWRYSRYEVRLFLITRNGVREVGGELDFEKITFSGLSQHNYSFNSISSILVTKKSRHGYVMDLNFIGGQTSSIRIMEPDPSEPEPDEDPEELAEINLDATGFAHAQHLLKGIAAEGPGWINREPPPDAQDSN